MATEPVTIDLEDDADRWRYVCPRGHRSWEPTNNHFWCVTCARDHHQDLDPIFTELMDRKRRSRWEATRSC